MADKTIGALAAVVDAAIGDLPSIAELYDDSLLAVEQKAQQYSGKPPVIQNGAWWTWNAEQQVYQNTGEAARGNLMYATFFVDIPTGALYMVTDNEYTGPQFRLSEGDLEVVLNYGG